MNPRDSAFTYQQATAVSATPVGQVIALYDAILRDLRQAMAGVEAGQIEKRVNATNHALLIVGELQGVLDFERGGEAARHLSDFYTLMRPLITQASMTNSREKFQDLVEKFARLRTAWSKVERAVIPSVPENQLRVSSPAPPAFSPPARLPSENSEDSGKSQWTA